MRIIIDTPNTHTYALVDRPHNYEIIVHASHNDGVYQSEMETCNTQALKVLPHIHLNDEARLIKEQENFRRHRKHLKIHNNQNVYTKLPSIVVIISLCPVPSQSKIQSSKTWIYASLSSSTRLDSMAWNLRIQIAKTKTRPQLIASRSGGTGKGQETATEITFNFVEKFMFFVKSCEYFHMIAPHPGRIVTSFQFQINVCNAT